MSGVPGGPGGYLSAPPFTYPVPARIGPLYQVAAAVVVLTAQWVHLLVVFRQAWVLPQVAHGVEFSISN